MLNTQNQIHPFNITSASTVIREHMNYDHISISKLASISNLDASYLKRVLNRTRWLNPRSADRIGSALNVSSKLLLNLDKNFKTAHRIR